MTILSKVASVLDALADEQDARPPAETRPDPLLDRLEARVGTPLSEGLRHKLAEDEELRRVLTPVIEAPESPRPLGEPAEKSATSSTPMSKSERRAEAEQAFADAIMARSAR